MAKSTKIVYVTQAQYDSLINDGSVTIYGVTYTYDANNTYLVREDGIEGVDVLSTGATAGQVLTADGNGGAEWAAGASGDVTASGTLSVGSVMVGLGNKLITALNGSNGKILGWNGGAVWQDPPKIYIHNLVIEATDANSNTYFFADHVYSTQSTALVTDINSLVEYVKKTADMITHEGGGEIYVKTVLLLTDNKVPQRIDLMCATMNETAIAYLIKSELVINSSNAIRWTQEYAGQVTTLTATDNISEV